MQQLSVTDLISDLGNFADTASEISQLELVITVDTSVAHLAGASIKTRTLAGSCRTARCCFKSPLTIILLIRAF